jgi:hypothetical protein
MYPRWKVAMTPQERDLITTLLQRLRDTTRSGEPKDPEADALIRQAVREQPDAPYFLTQTVLIQDLSLHQAQNRIAELEQQLQDANANKSSGSFLGGLFGGRESSPPPASHSGGPWDRGPQVAPPPPQGGYGQQGYGPGPQPPNAQQAPQQQAPQQAGGLMGGGFLRSAAATAAGVAGGALLFQGISSMFGSGYANSLGASMNPGLGESVANNYSGDSGGRDYGGGGDAGYSGGGDYSGGGGDYSGGGDYGGDDYGGGGDDGGGDFGGGGADY